MRKSLVSCIARLPILATFLPMKLLFKKESKSVYNLLYIGFVIKSLKYLERAPTFFEIDILLSFRIIINFLAEVAILFRASKLMPFVKAASPSTAITFSSPPNISLAAAIPRAADRAVPACPAPKASCWLSRLLQKPQ